MPRILRAPWTRQPPLGTALQIDWTNPLTRGLILAVVGGQPNDLVSGVYVPGGSNTGPVGVTPPVPYAGGMGVPAGAAVGFPYYGIPGGIPPDASNWTCLTLATLYSDATYQTDYVVGWAGEISAGFAIGVAFSTATFRSSIAGTNISHAVSLMDNREHLLGVSLGGGTGRAWKDGVQVASASCSTPTFSFAQNYTRFAVGSDSMTAGYKVPVGLTLLYSRELSAVEHAQLARNPWQVLVGRRVFVPATAAAPPVFHSAVGGGSGSYADTSYSSPALATTTGRFLVVLVSKYTSGTTITGVTDTAGNTYVRAGSSQGGDSNHAQETWYTAAPITGNAANVVTVSYSGTTQYRVVVQAEFSCAGATAMAFDAEATLALAHQVSNSLTTSADNDLIVGWFAGWDGVGEVSDGTTGIVGWDSAGSDDAALAYRVAGAAGSYDIDLSITGTNSYAITAKAFTFSASASTTQDLGATYTVTAGVQADRSAAFAIRGAVQADRGANYAVISAVQADRSGAYTISAGVQADRSAAYAVINAVQQDRSAAYAVVTGVQADRSAAYAITVGAQADLGAGYVVVNAAQADRSAAYVVANGVAADLGASYVVIAGAQADRSAAYSLAAPVSQDMSAAYSVATTVSSDRSGAYDILNGSAVTSDMAGAYTIAGTVVQDLPAAYGVHAAAAADHGAAYSVVAAVQADRNAAYAVVNGVQADRPGVFDILASAEADLGASWGMSGSTVSDLVGTFVIYGGGSGSGATAAEIAEAVWKYVIEGGLSAERMQRVMLAALAGTSTGVGGTGPETYYGRDGTTPRLEATFDAYGNRVAVTLNGA